MLGGHGQGLAKPEPVEVRQRRLLAGSLDLVRREYHRTTGPAEQPRNLVVESGEAVARVHDEQDEVSLVHRREHLPSNALDEWRGRRGVEAARVHDRRLPPLERDLTVEAVARDSRDVAHQRAPALHQAIEERRLADVGAADDGDDRPDGRDRKSTRLNSSHLGISYAVFCLKKKKKNKE